MKALSLRQPYAELIIKGDKTIEIRTWNTEFRGEFLIHAAQKVFEQDCIKFGIDPKTVTTGKIIGKVNLIGTKKYNTIEEFRKDFDKHKAEDRWFRQPCYGFILENPQRVKPFPAKGFLNFFEVKESILN
jgi:ASC-1-like (ASCH) protein